MKLLDIILAFICAEASALLINDLFGSYFFGARFLLFLMPILAIVFLWLADRAGKSFFFIWQLAKHLLVGLLVVLVDLKIFILLADWGSSTAKAISFLISVSTVKFLGNKYWAFEEKERNNFGKQFGVFFGVTLIGLIIDVGSFLALTKIVLPGLASQIWVKISVILAAICAAAWNFLSYKFIVFKK